MLGHMRLSSLARQTPYVLASSFISLSCSPKAWRLAGKFYAHLALQSRHHPRDFAPAPVPHTSGALLVTHRELQARQGQQVEAMCRSQPPLELLQLHMHISTCAGFFTVKHRHKKVLPCRSTSSASFHWLLLVAPDLQPSTQMVSGLSEDKFVKQRLQIVTVTGCSYAVT